MFGLIPRVISFVAGKSGSNAIGRRVKFYSAEGPEAESLENLQGTVVGRDNSAAVEVITVQLERPITIAGESIPSVYLTPRHVHYDSTVIAVFPISVFVAIDEKVDTQSVVGQVMMKLMR